MAVCINRPDGFCRGAGTGTCFRFQTADMLSILQHFHGMFLGETRLSHTVSRILVQLSEGQSQTAA